MNVHLRALTNKQHAQLFIPWKKYAGIEKHRCGHAIELYKYSITKEKGDLSTGWRDMQQSNLSFFYSTLCANESDVKLHAAVRT